MRIVDILYKNIEGQASDISGNIHNIGHLVFLPILEVNTQFLSGYFEVDGSVVIDAKKNYQKLYDIAVTWDGLSASNKSIIYKVAGSNDLYLNKEAAPLYSKGSSSTAVTGMHYPHKLNTPSLSAGTYPIKIILTPEHYTARLFIYHGVH